MDMRLPNFSAAAAAVVIAACAFTAGCSSPSMRVHSAPPDNAWQKLDTVAYRGKQDDIFFLTPDLGWYVNGAGKIYKTSDGGKKWVEKLSKAGTFFRTIGFVDENIGFAGNIGTDYFPGVTDTTPLYVTQDGGETWNAVASIDGPVVKGLCAIDVLHTKFINSGVMDSRTIIHAAGRVGGPAFLMRSMDGGKTWKSSDLSDHTKMILDVKFFNENDGLIMGATDSDASKSNALIIATKDGGATWQKVYQSNRLYELTWKVTTRIKPSHSAMWSRPQMAAKHGRSCRWWMITTCANSVSASPMRYWAGWARATAVIKLPMAALHGNTSTWAAR
jgi:photosystem II stability/assembly factor-like uncharacterized protein